ncbi:hypothetical protein [Winogradskyella schleiferi]|uniref:hypothetical protein n=1 Tax=Winogradskyella schleiferi TaxID=2686078 RepID=UPI0015BE3F25|nr:hypothetical protein [Winogradskyella schleiferi]
MKQPDYSDPNAKHELDYLELYEKKGYTENFRVENGKLIASQEKSKFSPEQVKIVAEHRYEGMSNPSDQSILYVIETDEDCKGTIINSYGPTANLEVHEFIESIPDDQKGHDESILNLDKDS